MKDSVHPLRIPIRVKQLDASDSVDEVSPEAMPDAAGDGGQTAAAGTVTRPSTRRCKKGEGKKDGNRASMFQSRSAESSHRRPANAETTYYVRP